MAALNYATEYARELTSTFPYTLYFGDLWNAIKPEVKFTDNDTVKIPKLTTTGRKNGDRDNITAFQRNFSNDWETKQLKTHRTWDTLVHPRDIDETNKVATIANITKTMNETEKFPEMDAEAITALYKLKNEQESITAKAKGYITKANVLSEFDALMDKMDEARVPVSGRILYADTYTKTLIDQAVDEYRRIGSNDTSIARAIGRIGEVEIKSVPTSVMKSAYKFYTGNETEGKNNGFEAETTAKDVKLFLVHPIAVIPEIVYTFAQLDEPSSLSKGHWTYFEESFEDMFIYNERHAAIQFVVENPSA